MFKQVEPKRLQGVITGDESWLYFYHIPNKQSSQVLGAVDGRDQLCFDQISRVESNCVKFFPNTQGPVMVDNLPQKSTLTATYYVEIVLPEVM